MLRTALAAIALLAITAPAHAKMECHRDAHGDEVCADYEAADQSWIMQYCTNHPADPECAQRGYRYSSTDPVEQKVDQRLTDHFCAANPMIFRCLSPFEYWRQHPDRPHS